MTRRPATSTLFPYTTLFRSQEQGSDREEGHDRGADESPARDTERDHPTRACARSEEHTSELQSPCNLVCRLLLEKKNRRSSRGRQRIGLPHSVRSAASIRQP